MAASGIENGMKQSMSKLDKVHSYLTFGMDSCIHTVSDIESYGAEAKDDSLQELRDMMLEFCAMDQDLKMFTEAFAGINQQTDGNETLEEILDKNLKKVVSSNKGNGPNKHEKFMELVECINEAQNPSTEEASEATPSVYEDGDIEVTQAEVQLKCPITGKEMVNPVKNKVCGHKYDKEGILNHIKLRQGKAKCPIGGCTNSEPIQEDQLEFDMELKKYIDKKNRQRRK